MDLNWRISDLWNWFKSSRFEIEARAHAEMLPVLSRQLRETVGSIESGAGEVCASFGEMAKLACSAAGMGAALVEEKGSPTVNDAINGCRVMLANLSDRLEHSGSLYARAIGQMEAANGSVNRVFQVLQELDQASFVSRIVAINAKIESVHLGHLGAGFEVVAEQISAQAARSAELTSAVVTVLTELTETMNTATTELKGLAEADKIEASRSREDAGQALIKLEHASARMQDTVSESSKASEALYGQISRAVVNMQFQDRVSQRLGHVIESIDAMSRALSEPERAASATLAERKRQVAQDLAATYTMPSERVAHEETGIQVGMSAHAETNAEADSGGEVELF